MRILIAVLFIAFGLLNTPVGASPPRPRQVLMIVNEGFWAPEHYVPRKLLENAGFKVVVAAKRVGPIPPDLRNTNYRPAIASINFSRVQIQDYDAIVFAGGNGAWTDYFPNEEVHKILQSSFQNNKIVALICSSTGLLGVTQNFDGRTPIAAGRKATGYYRVRGLIEKLGQINYEPGREGQPFVVVDGQLITGRDPISSELFGRVLVHELKKKLRPQNQHPN